jgi:hypothetical protein
MKIHNEFILNKQKCLWASNGRRNLKDLGGGSGAFVVSDATGADGEVCDEALHSLGILPFRAHLEGRSGGSRFDDIRDYPYLSIAAPTKDLSCSLREVWKTKLTKRKHLWEDELYETGQPPADYDDTVAAAIMKLHGWSGSMWVMFPLDSLIGAARHEVEIGGTAFTMLDRVCEDAEANAKISQILTSSKRTPKHSE